MFNKILAAVVFGLFAACMLQLFTLGGMIIEVVQSLTQYTITMNHYYLFFVILSLITFDYSDPKNISKEDLNEV